MWEITVLYCFSVKGTWILHPCMAFLLLLVLRFYNSTPLYYLAICLFPQKMPEANPWHLFASYCPSHSQDWGSLVVGAYLGSDSSVRPSGSQRSRKFEACNYWNPHGLPLGISDSFVVYYNCIIHQGKWNKNIIEMYGHILVSLIFLTLILLFLIPFPL